MDYGDIVYDKPSNESFKNKIESIQYKACIEQEQFKGHPGIAFIKSWN